VKSLGKGGTGLKGLKKRDLGWWPGADAHKTAHKNLLESRDSERKKQKYNERRPKVT